MTIDKVVEEPGQNALHGTDTIPNYWANRIEGN